MSTRDTVIACIALLFAASPVAGLPPGSVSPAHGSVSPVPRSVALAHEEAVLRSSQTSVAAGSSIELSGSDFAGTESYQLRLLGVLDEYDVGRVEADSSGVFSHQLAVPAEVAPGAYQVVAVASDGDVVARLDVTVLAAAAGGTTGTMAADHAMGDQAGPAARHDDIQIERDRSGVEWGMIGLVIGLAGGIGLGMVRRTPA
jgi:hypothetical protein